MGMYFECELNKIDIDEVLSTVRYIEPEDLVVLYREKIRRLESALKNSEDDNIRRSEMNKELSDKVECLGNNNRELLKENDKLRQDNKEFSDNIKKMRTQCSTLVGQRNKYYELYKQLTVENRRLHRGFAVLDLDNFIKEGVRERCFKLQAENEELKTQSSSLQKENVRLVEEREDLQKKNEYLSGSIEKICDIHAKEKAELKEQLEASSNLTMANELANIFAEYTVVDQKNRDDLGDKITEFRRKYGLE
jgi:septal ring factor EnvC (AmiA/AmiB activator)